MIIVENRIIKSSVARVARERYSDTHLEKKRSLRTSIIQRFCKIYVYDSTTLQGNFFKLNCLKTFH